MIPDFKKLLGTLVEAEVPFVLVGGYSAMLHGSSLMTRDVDIVCPMTSAALGRLHCALDPFAPVHRIGALKKPLTAEEAQRIDWKNLDLSTRLGILDCLGEVKGLGDYEHCLSRSIPLDLGSFSFRILSIEALIEAKRAMNRPRDIQTAEELEIISKQRRLSD